MSDEALPPLHSHDQRRARLSALRDRFLAVSLRSRTLRLTRASKSGALDLTRLPPAALPRVVQRLGTTETSDKATPIADVIGATNGATKAAGVVLSEDVATLAHAARAVLMETGADELAVGFPFLEGRTPDGTWLRAPLFLYPATLGQTRTGKLKWTLLPTGAPWLNTALCETLRRLAGVRLAHEDFAAKDEDGLFKIDDASWQAFVDTLRSAGLALDASLSLPAAPSPLEPRDEAAREAMPPGQFALVFNLVLGRFPASGSTLVLDYEQLLDGTLDDAAVGLAAPILAVDDEGGTPGAELASTPADDAQTHVLGRLRRWQVVPSDKSQDDVFRFLEAPLTPDTRGLVVQGPPGTGKSQLITNLLAAQIAEGQRVLLVCQKRAALDVVAERLERMGLREPVAVVHDVERDRSALYQAIGETLTRLLDDSEDGAEGDPNKIVADVEKQATRAGKDLAARLAGSQTAWEALTDEDAQPLRPSLAALDEVLLAHDEDCAARGTEASVPDLSAVLAEVGLDDLPGALRDIEAVAAQAAPFAPPHVFADRTDWSGYAAAEIKRLGERLHDLTASLAAWVPQAEASGLEATVLDAQHETIAAAEPLTKLAVDEDLRRAHGLFRAWRSLPAKRTADALASLLRTERQTLPSVPPELVALSPSEIGTRVTKLERLGELERKWWRIFLPTFWLLRGLPKKILGGEGGGRARGGERRARREEGERSARRGRSIWACDRRATQRATRIPAFRQVFGLGLSPALDLAQLHRDAARWQAFLVELPEHPIFHLAKVGDPASLDRPIALVESGLRIDASAAELHVALSGHGEAWAENKALAADMGPSALTLAVARELPRVGALAEVDRALESLGPSERGACDRSHRGRLRWSKRTSRRTGSRRCDSARW